MFALSLVLPISTDILFPTTPTSPIPSSISPRKTLLGTGHPPANPLSTPLNASSSQNPFSTSPTSPPLSPSPLMLLNMHLVLSSSRLTPTATGTLAPMYLLQSFSPAERNYDIYDHELLAVIRALKSWHHYLHGSPFPVQVFTDHKNLTYFHQPQALNH